MSPHCPPEFGSGWQSSAQTAPTQQSRTPALFLPTLIPRRNRKGLRDRVTVTAANLLSSQARTVTTENPAVSYPPRNTGGFARQNSVSPAACRAALPRRGPRSRRWPRAAPPSGLPAATPRPTPGSPPSLRRHSRRRQRPAAPGAAADSHRAAGARSRARRRPRRCPRCRAAARARNTAASRRRAPDANARGAAPLCPRRHLDVTGDVGVVQQPYGAFHLRAQRPDAGAPEPDHPGHPPAAAPQAAARGQPAAAPGRPRHGTARLGSTRLGSARRHRPSAPRRPAARPPAAAGASAASARAPLPGRSILLHPPPPGHGPERAAHPLGVGFSLRDRTASAVL